MGKKSHKLEKVAYHEAGHAVACIVQGMIIDEITIKPNKTHQTEGSLMIYGPRPTTPKRALQRSIILLAGPTAEAIAYPDMAVNGHNQDLADVKTIISAWFGTVDARNNALSDIYLQTLHLLTKPANWHLLTILAETLLREQALSGQQAKDLFLKVLNTMPDETFETIQNRLQPVRQKLITNPPQIFAWD